MTFKELSNSLHINRMTLKKYLDELTASKPSSSFYPNRNYRKVISKHGVYQINPILKERLLHGSGIFFKNQKGELEEFLPAEKRFDFLIELPEKRHSKALNLAKKRGLTVEQIDRDVALLSKEI